MRHPRVRAQRGEAFFSIVLFGLVGASVLLLGWAWLVREERHWTAETGFGYGLGVLGTAFMLLLLLYSVRKRARATRDWGHLRYWFRAHMALGILGPVAILLHSNFRLGSRNSSVALGCVLIVSSSGFIGRFIYPKIHHRLSGRRATLRELERDAETLREKIRSHLRDAPGVASGLRELEDVSTHLPEGLLRSATRLLVLGRATRSVRRAARREVPRAASREQVLAALDAYALAVRRVAQFATYERLFWLWHAFHLPLCFMLFAAAAIHVIAVHMY